MRIAAQSSRTSTVTAYAVALAMTAVATAAALIIDAATNIPNLSMIFVLPVVIAAVSFGWGPAMVAAVAGVLAYNFFLIEPRYDLRVADPANALALGLLFVIATLISAVAAQSRRRALVSLRKADQEGALHGFAHDLMGAGDIGHIAQASAEALNRIFEAPAVVQVETDDTLRTLGMAGDPDLTSADEEAARWSIASRLPTRGGAYPVSDAAYDFWPVISRQRRVATLGVRLSGRDEGRPAEPERLVEIVGGYLAVALDREALAAEALDARVQVAGERMKGDLLAAVSHDLKTPLSTILLTLQSLQKFGAEHDAAARAELLALAEAETARLSGMVSNLLDVDRLEAGALAVHPRPLPAADLAAAALARANLQGRRIDNRLNGGAPLWIDPVLAETALVNVLENAAKYAPPGSTVTLSGGTDQDVGWIEVLDEGSGFAGPVEPLFEKFARGVQGDGRAPGTGLGLAIARGFMQAQGGGVEAANRQDRSGARVRLTAPLAPSPAPAA